MSRPDDTQNGNPLARTHDGVRNSPRLNIPHIDALFPGLRGERVASSLTNYQSAINYMNMQAVDAVRDAIGTAPLEHVAHTGSDATLTTGITTYDYRSSAADISFTFDKGATRHMRLTLSPQTADDVLNHTAMDSTDSVARSFGHFANLLGQHLAWVPGGNADRMLEPMRALQGQWAFSYGDDGISRIQLNGRDVPRGSNVWAMGESLQEAALKRAAADNIIDLGPTEPAPAEESMPGETMLGSIRAHGQLAQAHVPVRPSPVRHITRGPNPSA